MMPKATAEDWDDPADELSNNEASELLPVETKHAEPVHLEMSEAQGRDFINQTIGQVQMANVFSSFSQTFGVSKLKLVKESKLYKYMAGMNVGGLEFKGTWVEFCGLLGISDEKANQDIANLNAFGESALEAMQSAGVGYRDLGKFRKLPDDERTKLIEVAKDGDKEALLDLAEMLIEKHTKEKSELVGQVEQLKVGKTQAGVQVQKAEAEAKNYQKQLAEAAKTRADISDIVPPHVSDIRLEVAALHKKAELSIDGIAHQINEVGFLEGEWSVSAARSTFAALQSLIAQARGAAAQLHRAYGAELDGDNSTLERLTQKELFKCATEFKELIGEHEHEAALREYERDLNKPKGKGRPKAAPVKD